MLKVFTSKRKNENRHREGSFTIGGLAQQLIKFLLSSLFLVLILAAIFLFSYLNSSSTIDSLRLDSKRLSLAHQLAYMPNLLVGTFYAYLVFINSPEFLINNQAPPDAMAKYLEDFGTANERVLALFSNGSENMDPIIHQILNGKCMCLFKC